MGEEAWQHTKRLYARFQQSPLWYEKDGLDKERVDALTNALLRATDDGLALDEYPIGDVARAIGSVRDTKQPTAEQLADADVLLTAAYASLGEDLLVGQVNPKTVGQSWHIDTKDENVDSALVRTLTKMPLDKSMNAMRPADSGYAALQKEMARYRDVVAKGGWQPIPAGKALKRGQSDSPVRLAALRARLAAEGIEVPEATTASAANDSTGAATSASSQRRLRRHGDAPARVERRRVRRGARERGRRVPDATRHQRRQLARHGDARRAQRAGRISARPDRREPRALSLAAAQSRRAVHLRERARVPAHRVRQGRDGAAR